MELSLNKVNGGIKIENFIFDQQFEDGKNLMYYIPFVQIELRSGDVNQQIILELENYRGIEDQYTDDDGNTVFDLAMNGIESTENLEDFEDILVEVIEKIHSIIKPFTEVYKCKLLLRGE